MVLQMRWVVRTDDNLARDGGCVAVVLWMCRAVGLGADVTGRGK